VDAAAAELYKRSHAAFGPGEQRTRSYDWSGIGVDPAAHRFGAVAKEKSGRGVALALNPQEDKSAVRGAVVALSVAQQRLYATDQLGSVKKCGRGPTNPPESFGVTKRKPGDEVTAAQVLRGEFPWEQQMPDKDLGKSVRPGFRNVTKDPARTFGIPTIRSDIPARSAVSMSDVSNYGDGPSASDLLNPSRFADLGIDHSDFVVARTPQEIRDVFSSIGNDLTDTEFEKIWLRAATAYDLNRNGEVSVEEFRLALNEYQDAVAAGEPPAWFFEE